MPDAAPDLPGESFAERLNWLFRSVTDGDGKPYSVRHVAAEITRRGCKMSHTHLNDLRQGRADDPRQSEVEAIASFFGRPVSFLTGVVDHPQPDLVNALANPHIRTVAMRLVGARLSPEGHEAVVAMIDQVERLEAAARQRREGHQAS